MNRQSPSTNEADTLALRNGGQILVAALRLNGTDRIFGVPGESALPVFDALYKAESGVEFIQSRHEATASHMAEADGKLTQRPGVCIVSRGPGAMQAAIGVHTAWQDSTPMILIIGQVPRAFKGREAFQEMDYTRTFDDMTKWAAEISSADQIPEYVNRAYATAMQGRPGPVVLSVPEDVLSDLSAVVDAKPVQPVLAAATVAQAEQAMALLQKAERPLFVLGNIGWNDASVAIFRAFAERNDVPVMAGLRSQDVLNNTSEQYVGDMSLGGSKALGARMKEADLLFVIGDRLGDVTTQHYSVVDAPTPKQTLIHVFPGAEDLGRVFTPTLGIQANSSLFMDALSACAPLDASRWSGWRKQLRDDFVAYQEKPKPVDGFDMSKVIKHLNEQLGDNDIVTNGAGNYAIWLHRFYRYRARGTQLAPKSGTMGYGLPAAIAAQLRHRDRRVVCLAGDGCFMMASQDFATTMQNSLPIICIVVNNGLYGSIRMHQENQFPGRPSGTDLLNPDFAALARSYGAHGETVERDADFPAAYARAVESGKPAIIEVRVNPAQITPDRVL